MKFKEKTIRWSYQLEELLTTILNQRKEIEELQRVLERSQDRISEYKAELAHHIQLANIWCKRVIEAGWKK